MQGYSEPYDGCPGRPHEAISRFTQWVESQRFGFNQWINLSSGSNINSFLVSSGGHGKFKMAVNGYYNTPWQYMALYLGVWPNGDPLRTPDLNRYPIGVCGVPPKNPFWVPGIPPLPPINNYCSLNRVKFEAEHVHTHHFHLQVHQ